jgi:hypothetical protein
MKRCGYQSNEDCYALGATLRAVPVMTEGGNPWMYGLAPCAHECKDQPNKPCPACDWEADMYARKADTGSSYKIRPLGQRKPRSLFPATLVQFPKKKKKRKLLLKKQQRKKRKLPPKDQD